MLKPKNSLIVTALALSAFFFSAWVIHRALRHRQDCVHSQILAYVRWSQPEGGAAVVENCSFSSRLEIHPDRHGLTFAQISDLQKLEAAAQNVPSLGTDEAKLSLELSPGREFTLVRGAVRLGRGWLSDPSQVQRALTLAYLRTEQWRTFDSQFQLEVAADFWTLIHDGTKWARMRKVNFATAAADFSTYCHSPFRSLAHAHACSIPALTHGTVRDGEDGDDLFGHVWGMRASLVAGLYRAYSHLSLGQKIMVLQRFRKGVRWPVLSTLPNKGNVGLGEWLKVSLSSDAHALGIDVDGGSAIELAKGELRIDEPLTWDLTVDLTHTPAWREILSQFTAWSRFRPFERTLLITPAGQIGLPTGWPVHWALDQIRSVKHLLIACEWPAAKEVLKINAQQTFAQRSCVKLTETFWD